MKSVVSVLNSEIALTYRGSAEESKNLTQLKSKVKNFFVSSRSNFEAGFTKKIDLSTIDHGSRFFAKL